MVMAMRTFYAFKINKELSILLKDSPYNLYRCLENIYYMDSKNAMLGRDLLEQVISLINVNNSNKLIYEKNKNNDFYTKIGSHHRIINKYRAEETNIWVKNTHYLITTNTLPRYLINFIEPYNIFICDFENKDYFWLTKLIVKV